MIPLTTLFDEKNKNQKSSWACAPHPATKAGFGTKRKAQYIAVISHIIFVWIWYTDLITLFALIFRYAYREATESFAQYFVIFFGFWSFLGLLVLFPKKNEKQSLN